MRLQGKVAIVSGAARGLGLAQAELFCEHGAQVVLGDILCEQGEGEAARLRRKGLSTAFHPLDVSKRDDWAAIVEFACGKFGALTTLVNNAGVYKATGLEDETDESWAQSIAIDQTGVFLGMQIAMPHLIASGNGAVVNISSVMGLMGTLRCFGYHAAKGAVRMMSRAAAVQYASQNVRVNCIFPGSIVAASHSGSPPQDSSLVRLRTPMGRKGVPNDVAYASLYLCSDEAAFVTGAELVVDGGMYVA